MSKESNSWWNAAKIGGVVGATVGAAVCGYMIWRNRYSRSICGDEGFAETNDESSFPIERKILILGLTESGKTCLVRKLTAVHDDVDSRDDISIPKPTQGFNVTSITKDDRTFVIWEIGGSSQFRPYWNNFFQDTDLLVFVVDSGARDQLPVAYDELRKALSDSRLASTPLLIVANKKDLESALPLDEILKELMIGDVRTKVQGISTSCLENSREELQKCIFRMCK